MWEDFLTITSGPAKSSLLRFIRKFRRLIVQVKRTGKARNALVFRVNVRLRLIGINLPSAPRVLDIESVSEKKLRIMYVLCGCQVPCILFDKQTGMLRRSPLQPTRWPQAAASSEYIFESSTFASSQPTLLHLSKYLSPFVVLIFSISHHFSPHAILLLLYFLKFLLINIVYL